MKKPLIIISIIIFVLIFGFLAYLGMSGQQNQDGTNEGGGITFREFFPFGGREEEPLPSTPTEEPGGGLITDPTAPNAPGELPKIRKIYAGPVAGIIATEKTRVNAEDETITDVVSAVRTVNRVTGHIVDIFPDTTEQVTVSSRTIPKIHEALFGPLGSSVVFRYLSDDLETAEAFAASFVPGASAENALKGTFLPENLISLSVDDQNGKLFYLQDFDGDSMGSTADPDGLNKKTIFNHPFSEWSTDFITSTKILFTTKPSGLVAGYSYILNTQNNVFEKLTGGINGLTILANKTGDKFLFGEGNSTGMKISFYDLKTTIGTSINTIPEKCVWSVNGNDVYCGIPINPQSGTYPDAWYQGQISFNDSVEKFNLTSGTKEIIGFPDGQVDLINPSLSKDEKYLYFINKRDGSVWVVDLQKN